LAILFSIALLSLAAALLINRPLRRTGNEGATRSTPPEAGASLRAERQGEDLKILWDLNSPAVGTATSGVLDIDDGGTKRQILMTADQIRFGSLLYSPASGQVAVRLSTRKDNQTTAQASVLVLLNKPVPPQPSTVHQSPQSPQISQVPQIPLESKTEPKASPRAFIPPTVKRDINPTIEVEDLPALQVSPERLDALAPLPTGSVLPPPVIAAARSEPAQPREEYVAPVLISEVGMRTPRELAPLLLRPVLVRVRVNVNESGRVTRAEAIAEKGIHALLLSAAADAARRCRFQPARRGQLPVSSSAVIVFHFSGER
jgi:TonB family protein